MRKHMKIVLLASVLTLALAFSLVLASEVETKEEFIPFRTRVMEILQKNPEILKEIEAVREEYGAWDKPEFAESEDGFFGRMRGRMGGGYCHGQGRAQKRQPMWDR